MQIPETYSEKEPRFFSEFSHDKISLKSFQNCWIIKMKSTFK